jgi:spore coat protein H
VDRCTIDLGNDPWDRLERTAAAGTLRWNGGAPMAVRVRLRGAHSRRFPKKSLQVSWPDDGFADPPPEGHTVRRLHLNADFVDPTLVRSSTCFRLFELAGVPAPKARHVLLSVSGRFEGIYVGLESVDKDFCKRRGWAAGAILYAVNRNANFGVLSPFTQRLKEPLEAGYQEVTGAGRRLVRQMLLDLNLADESRFPESARRWIDLPAYLRWVMVAVFVGNRDGFVHNYALCHDPSAGFFRLVPWDYDATFGIDIKGRPARLDRVPVCGWNKLTHRLLALPAYRTQYRDLFTRLLGSIFAPDRVAAVVDRLGADVAPWIAADPYGSAEAPRYADQLGQLKQWAKERRLLLLRKLANL